MKMFCCIFPFYIDSFLKISEVLRVQSSCDEYITVITVFQYVCVHIEL